MERGQRSKKKSPEEDKPQTETEFETCLGNHIENCSDNAEYIFLLEFFIHFMTSNRLAKLNQMFFVPTTISVEFLRFSGKDSIEITPVDPLFQPQAGVADDVEYFYSGRSVMFAIDQYTVANKLLDLIIKLNVQKKMPEGVKPDVPVGNGELDLSMHFAALRKEMLQCWHKMLPPPKVFEGEVPLTYNGQAVGAVYTFVRISAFGQTIVTEFEAPPDRTVSSFLFKAADTVEKPVAYKCRIVDSRTEEVCRVSKTNLTAVAPCRVCVKEQHPCTPCGRSTGATLKPNVIYKQENESTKPVARVKSLTCADVPKQSNLIQSSRGPAQPCGKAVVLKVSGILDTGQDKKPRVTVAPESEATPPDCSDPNHDVFVLRIGKKGIVGAGEKSDIQLEMRTPKGAERGLPIRCETREIQTEDSKPKSRKKKKKK